MTEKIKPLLISCSVLKAEILRLIEQGDLDVDVVFVSKLFHVDYALIEENLRPTIERNMNRSKNGIVLVYGDLCLGPNGEMKQLAAQYGIVKVDALNCTDCLLGGKGKSLTVDPNHELMILSPGMNGFFESVQAKAKKEGVEEEALKSLFNGLRGIVLLDTLDQAEEDRKAAEKIPTGLAILETKRIGLEGLKQVLTEALTLSRQKLQKQT
ncbi:MAG: DUF1638 domain-containing protein [Candidatus Bathyarchaeia archaeon]